MVAALAFLVAYAWPILDKTLPGYLLATLVAITWARGDSSPWTSLSA